MTTKLAIAYCLGIEQIYRCRPEPFGGTAIDLACGPGHMSLCMAKHLKLDQVIGIDLSRPMVETANRNAIESGADAATFRVGDVTNLRQIPDSSCDLSTFCDAAHHLPDLATVRRVLQEMDRITKPEGLVFVMDLARLRTGPITENYVQLLGSDYVERGLECFYKDFRDSMHAAWTTAELKSAVANNTLRSWHHIAPIGLPSVQFIMGTPRDGKNPYRRTHGPWSIEGPPLAPRLRHEWHMLRSLLRGKPYRQ